MTFRTQDDTIKIKRIISWPIVILSILQFAMIFFFKYVSGGDQSSGYVTGFFLPLVYVVSFALIVTPIVQMRNRTVGLLDLVVVFIVLIATYLMLSAMGGVQTDSNLPGTASTSAPVVSPASTKFGV